MSKNRSLKRFVSI